MKSNFEFSKEYWPALAQIGETAENYLYSDPNACIYKIGLFAERLVQEILVFEGIVEPENDNTHANRIRLLKRAGLLPHEIDNTLYLLRKTRNSAVHAGADSVDVAKELISMTYNLATWFMKTYEDCGGDRLVNFILLCRNYAKAIYYMESCVIYTTGQNGGFKAFTEMCNDL